MKIVFLLRSVVFFPVTWNDFWHEHDTIPLCFPPLMIPIWQQQQHRCVSSCELCQSLLAKGVRPNVFEIIDVRFVGMGL